MNKILLVSALAALTLSTPALAEVRNNKLPDGSTSSIVFEKKGGVFAPGVTVATSYHCAGVPLVCTLQGEQTSAGPGLASIIIPSGAVYAAAKALRPDKHETYVSSYADSQSRSQGGNAFADASRYQYNDESLNIYDY